MIFPLGALVNAGTIILGSGIGLLLGNRLSERMRQVVFAGLGLSVFVLGVQMAMASQHPMVMIFSVLLGGITGELLHIEEGLNSFGKWIKAKVGSKDDRFVDGFISASLLYAIGSLAILGPFNEALNGDRTVHFTKAVLDGFSAIPLSAAMGSGVALSSLPVLVYQGLLTLFAASLQSVLTPPVMTELIATGGLLVMAVSLGIAGIKNFPISSMLPALLYAPIFASFFV